MWVIVKDIKAQICILKCNEEMIRICFTILEFLLSVRSHLTFVRWCPIIGTIIAHVSVKRFETSIIYEFRFWLLLIYLRINVENHFRRVMTLKFKFFEIFRIFNRLRIFNFRSKMRKDARIFCRTESLVIYMLRWTG